MAVSQILKETFALGLPVFLLYLFPIDLQVLSVREMVQDWNITCLSIHKWRGTFIE